MKKFIAGLLTVALCFSSTCMAMAEFTPSVDSKPSPNFIVKPNTEALPVLNEEGEILRDYDVVVNMNIIGRVIDEEGMVLGISDEHAPCIIITPISEAMDAVNISEEDRAILMEVYEKLLSGEMKLSDIEWLNELVKKYFGADKDGDYMVIRDLFDVNIECETLTSYVNKVGTSIVLDFDLGVESEQITLCMRYSDGEWHYVPAVNNGDGTVTCTFEENCPVAFMIVSDAGNAVDMSETGNGNGKTTNVALWTTVAAASAVLLFLIARRKKETEE